MITYQYKAMSADGLKINGLVEAVDEYAAVSKIKQTCPIVLKIEPVKEHGQNILTMEIGNPKVDQKALAVMCSQFAIILKSGVTISHCMEMIARQTEDKKLHKMLEKSAEDVSQGNSVATSFEKNCKGLPVTFVETVRAGEKSGTLEKSFDSLSSYYEKAYKLNQKVKQALTYPIFVVIIAIIVTIIVMVKVVPTIATTFNSLNGELPMITKLMIANSNFIQKYWMWIAGIILAVMIGCKVYFNTEKGRIFWNRLKLKIPVFGRIGLLNGSSQFANTMATLITAGLTVEQALEITAKVLDNYALSIETARMTGKISEGQKLGDCLKKSNVFPSALNEMCAIGEDTGEMEETLHTVADFFEGEAETATAKAIAKLEPAIMVFMAIFAGFLVIAIYLPMFTMYGLM